jgi:uncharacterized protein (DUF58 family)
MFLLLISYIYSIVALKDIDLNRYSRGAVRSVGDIYEERIEIRNNSKTPGFRVEVIDKSGVFTKINSRIINWLKPDETISFVSHSYLNQRGDFSLGPITLKTGDPFGFFEKEITFNSKKRLVVYPFRWDLRQFPINPGLAMGGTYLHVKTRQTTPQAATIREFQPGDPLNRVHWPLTMKKQKLMVKEFDEDTQSSVWIFIDVKKGNYFHSRDVFPAALNRNLIPLMQKMKYVLPRDCFEYAVSIAASIVFYCTKQNLAVGLTAVGEKLTNFPAEKGKRQLGKILTSLSTIKDDGNNFLEDVIEKQVRNIGRGSLLILIMPHISERMNKVMSFFKKRGYQYLIFNLNNSSFKNPEQFDELNPRNGTIRVRYGEDLSATLEGGLS